MKNNLYKNQARIHQDWGHVLDFDFKKDFLGLKPLLPEYYTKFIENSELIAVIPALPKGDEKSRAYFSCPIKEIEIEHENNGIKTNMMPRLSPVYIIDNSIKISELKEDLFHVDMVQKTPLFMDYKQKDFYKERVFLLDSEVSNMYSYKNGAYSKSLLFDDYLKHVLNNPVVLFFCGCDDGHVGLRFPDKKTANDYISGLSVFEDIFKNSDNEFTKNLIKIKKESGASVSELLSGNIEFHN